MKASRLFYRKSENGKLSNTQKTEREAFGLMAFMLLEYK